MPDVMYLVVQNPSFAQQYIWNKIHVCDLFFSTLGLSPFDGNTPFQTATGVRFNVCTVAGQKLSLHLISTSDYTAKYKNSRVVGKMVCANKSTVHANFWIMRLVSDSEAEKFLQRVSCADLVHMEVINFVANTHHSAAFAQLASRNSAMDLYGTIVKLEKEALQDAAYCDEQLSETSANESDMEDVKLKAQLDTKSANFAMTMDQAKLTKIRVEEYAAFSVEKADLEQGIQGDCHDFPSSKF